MVAPFRSLVVLLRMVKTMPLSTCKGLYRPRFLTKFHDNSSVSWSKSIDRQTGGQTGIEPVLVKFCLPKILKRKKG